ncbi:MAG: hypothetical protein PHG97_02510 [Candidatus Margulisbacteria bacterium]|nr:hypothetical protein [Candidatus Margulisiibacteriota bacterium]
MDTKALNACINGLKELGTQLDELTLNIANSATSGDEIHLVQLSDGNKAGTPGSVDVTANTSAGLFAITQEVSINERSQTVVSAAPKKGVDLEKGYANEYKQNMRG